MKKTIALYGRADVGKSTTIWSIQHLLNTKYPNLIVLEEPKPILEGDIRIVVNIGGYIIGIESQGDPNSRIFETIDIFVKINVDVIICATRTRGATCDKISDLENKGYKVEWVQQSPEQDTSKQKSKNDEMASLILSKIENFLSIKINSH